MQNVVGKIRNHSCLQASLTCVKTFMRPLTRAEIEPVSITRRMYIRVAVQEQFLKWTKYKLDFFPGSWCTQSIIFLTEQPRMISFNRPSIQACLWDGREGI